MVTDRAALARASRDLRVFISNRESRCDDCGEDLGRRAMIVLAGDRGALCLTCADLDHLTFLASGDAALTRRARKHSTLAAVVLKWSRARKRYERLDDAVPSPEWFHLPRSSDSISPSGAASFPR